MMGKEDLGDHSTAEVEGTRCDHGGRWVGEGLVEEGCERAGLLAGLSGKHREEPPSFHTQSSIPVEQCQRDPEGLRPLPGQLSAAPVAGATALTSPVVLSHWLCSGAQHRLHRGLRSA